MWLSVLVWKFGGGLGWSFTGMDVLVDKVLAGTVTVVVVNGRPRHVDGELLEVGPAVPVQLCIEVRKQAPLKQRILGEVDAAHNVAGLEHDLLRLGKEVGGVAVQLQHSQLGKRNELLGDNLGRIEQVKAKGLCLLFVDDLDCQLPGRAVARLDGIPEVLAVKVWILASHDLCFFPDQAGLALERLEVPLDELGGAIILYESVGVDTETVLIILAHHHHHQLVFFPNAPCDGSYGGCQIRPWPKTGCAKRSAGS